MNYKKYSLIAFKILVYVFAITGFSFVAVYFAVKFKLTNTSGIIDRQNEFFQEQAVAPSPEVSSEKLDSSTICTFTVGVNYARNDVVTIFNTYNMEHSIALSNRMASTLFLVLSKNSTFKAQYEACLNDSPKEQTMTDLEQDLHISSTQTAYQWAQGEEWQAISSALLKDAPVINRAAKAAQIEPRFIVSALIVEQLRLFYSDRELFKQVFSPLKILGNQSQFSWGVMGMKEETAIAVEANLKNQSSPYYLGATFEHMLDFPSTTTPETIGQDRFARMTDEHNHYYSYLYAGIYMKQLMAQWQKAGFPINNRPEILATLYNIGFSHSKPSANPAVGGAEIKINNQIYSFGSLANEFYYSGMLSDLFPY